MVREVSEVPKQKKKGMWAWCTIIVGFPLNVLLQKISILPRHPLTTWKVYQFTSLNLSLKVLTVFFRLQDPPPSDLFNDRFWCADWTVSGNIQYILPDAMRIGQLPGEGVRRQRREVCFWSLQTPTLFKTKSVHFVTLLRSRDLFWGPKYNTLLENISFS